LKNRPEVLPPANQKDLIMCVADELLECWGRVNSTSNILPEAL